MLGRKGKAVAAWPAGAKLAFAASLVFLATYLVLAAGLRRRPPGPVPLP